MGYSRFRARCVPLQYPSSAIAGVKEAQNFNNFNKHPLNQNMIVVSTPLQEKITTSDSLNKESADQVSQLESGMFCELSNKNRMECEKYQDCSWFQQSPMKLDCNTKSSLAETIDSFIDADEFDLPMQYADAQPSPWGDEYLEVFTDDIILEDSFKLGEKNENFYTNYKEDEDNAFDASNINFTLKKTDSFDSMKNISSTNPAEVIPISYKERLSNSNYGMTKLDEGITEIKKEVELYSPESNSYVMDSDDNDLSIGREEIVEELNSAEDLYIASKNEIIGEDKLNDVPTNKLPSNYGVNGNIGIGQIEIKEENFNQTSLPVKTENCTDKNPTAEKFDLNLDIAKLSFDQPLNVTTPDLDFMDLVDFINEEMRQESNNAAFENSTSNNAACQKSGVNDLISTQNHCNGVQPNSSPSSENSSSQNQSVLSSSSAETKDSSTVDFNEVSNPGVSIAERIKTSAKRRTRKTIQDCFDSEDEESSDDVVDDEDYDYAEDIAKRRYLPTKRRTQSSLSESSTEGKRAKEESISYRERRDKNNEASRRSRQNRKARERHMYETLEEEEKRNVKLKAEADVLEKQVTSLRQLLLQVVLRKGGAT